MHEDELSEQLHEHDEEYELTADGIPKCLIRDLSEHEPELSAEELFEVDRQACLFEVVRLGSKSVLVQVAGPLPGHRTLSTKFVLSWRQKCIEGREVWLRVLPLSLLRSLDTRLCGSGWTSASQANVTAPAGGLVILAVT